jgi:hypothetical protein
MAANGYVASHVLGQLLNTNGFFVRASVGSQKESSQIAKKVLFHHGKCNSAAQHVTGGGRGVLI